MKVGGLLAKTKTMYVCSECGYESHKWLGKCPDCMKWNTMEEEIREAKTSSGKGKAVTPLTISTSNTSIKRLNEVTTSKSDRIVTNINEFNRVMGGGIVKDSITILTARPGAGKSTLLLQVAQDVASKGHKVIYASGEESDSQIKNRATRILDSVNDNIWIVSSTSLNVVLGAINTIDPDLIIIDSIQTVTLDEYLPSRAGSPTQTMECANELLKVAKNGPKPRAVMLVGQMTKNDEIAGLRALEHLVDTVLMIEGDSDQELRTFLSTKNRFGSTGEMGFFNMAEKGLVSIDNPSQYFMTQRELGHNVSGSALSVIREGSRPIILEVESLVSSTSTPYPLRVGESLKRDQLSTLISILEQRGGISLFNKNVVIKATGGLKLSEQSVNLAIIMSIVSSILDKPIDTSVVFIADVGLTGELKKVPSLEVRIKELDRMGYKSVVIPKNSFSRPMKFENIKCYEFRTLHEVINFAFKN